MTYKNKNSCPLYKEGIRMEKRTQRLLGDITEVNGKSSFTLNRDLSYFQHCKKSHNFSYSDYTFIQKASSKEYRESLFFFTMIKFSAIPLK